MGKVDLIPKVLSNPAGTVTCSKSLMNVIMVMNLINKQLRTIWDIGIGHESDYSLVETGSGQPSILSTYSATVQL